MSIHLPTTWFASSRLHKGQAKLSGVVFTPDTIANVESGVLNYVTPDRCVSQAQEMMTVKKDRTINVEQDGRMRVAAKPVEMLCETSTDAKLRAAWNRRSLAMDLASICSYIEIEKWVQHLFACQSRDVPKGLSPLTAGQLVQADKALFIHASESLMGTLQQSLEHPSPWMQRSCASLTAMR